MLAPTRRLSVALGTLLALGASVLFPGAAHAAGSNPPSSVTQLSVDTADSDVRVAFGVSTFVAHTARASGTSSVVARSLTNGGTPIWTVTVPYFGPGTQARLAAMSTTPDGSPLLAVVEQSGSIARTFVATLNAATGAVHRSMEIAPAGSGSFTATAVGANGLFGYVIGNGTGKFAKKATKKQDIVVAGIDTSTMSTVWFSTVSTADDDTALAAHVSTNPAQITILRRTIHKKANIWVDAFKLDGKKLFKGRAVPGIDATTGAIAVDENVGIAFSAGAALRRMSLDRKVVDVLQFPGATARSIGLGGNGMVVTGATISGDAVTAGYDRAGGLAWTDVQATAAEDAGADVLFRNGCVVVAGTTAGALAGPADAGGDVFVGRYVPNLPQRPSDVRDLQVLPGTSKVAISWTAPEHLSGLTPAYTVFVREAGATKLVEFRTASPSATTGTVNRKDLKAGRLYLVSVSATTAAGTSNLATTYFLT